MANGNLVGRVTSNIKLFLNSLGSQHTVVNNELHLQMLLAKYLESKGYQLLYEYHVPTGILNGKYQWKNRDMYIDIVVYDEHEYVPIEIKYKTRKLNTATTIFNQLVNNVDVLCDQGAQDIGRYSFWKDIYRLELVRSTFPTVMHGIALFVTNDPAYINNTNDPRVNYYDFHMKDGRTNVTGPLDWQNNNSKVANDHPGFSLAGMYDIHWTPIGVHSNPRGPADFSYCLVIV